MDTFEIIINSRGRWDKVITLDQMPIDWCDYTTLVVSGDELDLYHERHGDRVNVVSHPTHCTDLTRQRQWVMESSNAKFVMLLDDDLLFFTRNNEGKLTRSTNTDMDDMFHAVIEALREGYALVGISSRFGNNNVPEDFKTTTRVSRAYVLNREVFMNLGLSFLPRGVTIPFSMQDFHITLELLKRGYDNKVFFKWSQDDPGSNTAGGCANYRTLETLRQSAMILSRIHHPFVKLKVKTTKGSWSKMDGIKNTSNGVARVDVTVSWKKAFKPTQRKAGGFDKL